MDALKPQSCRMRDSAQSKGEVLDSAGGNLASFPYPDKVIRAKTINSISQCKMAQPLTACYAAHSEHDFNLTLLLCN